LPARGREGRVHGEALHEGGVTEPVVFGEEDGVAEQRTALRRGRRVGSSEFCPEVVGACQLNGIISLQCMDAA
jgi:hypothetical protein